jgi:CubicO group peptidase (beta-lactamase class C family)/pimeloyl-ACP methyl ester carboxylesterase
MHITARIITGSAGSFLQKTDHCFMNKGTSIALLALCIQLTFAQSNTRPRYDFSYLDTKINGWVDSGYYKGAAIALVKDNQLIHKKYFGNNKPETVVFIASAGKWLAAATIAAVVDEGKLHWDDKVSKWLPEFKDMKGQATLAQLLSHTAGYPDYQPADQPIDLYQNLTESVAHIVPLPADTLPGTKFRYGGLAMQVAGRMAELATGKDWETLFREKIAIPLEMPSTHFTPVDSSGGHAPMLGGGARSTLNDYMHFLSMIYNRGIYNGKRILSKQAVAAMQKDQVLRADISAERFMLNIRTRTSNDIYGLGEWREAINAQGDPVLISSPSWAGAYPWIDYEHHLYGFFITHITGYKNGFNSFYGSPVLPLLVRDALQEAAHAEVKRGFVQVEKGKLFYEERGQGEPLIFIHGHSFDHSEWDPQFYTFSKKYRVIRYDVRGYGRSSMPVEFSNTSHADDLARLMDALKIKKAHVVGLSMGGFIGLDFLVTHQDRLLSVTLASGDVWMGSPGPGVPWTEEAIAARRKEINELYTKGIDSFKREWFNALTIRNGMPIEHLRKPIWNMIYKWDAWQPTHVETRFLLGAAVIEKLKAMQIHVPVMVLTGEADAQHKSKVLELVPSAVQAFVPHAGHVSNLENATGFNEALEAWLQKGR